jgi:predicted O-methyltransferase YrrM
MLQVNQKYTKNYNFPSKAWSKILSPLKNKKSVQYLELGVFEGRSLIWVGENILPKGSRIDAVDRFGESGHLDLFQKNTESLQKTHELRIFQGWCAEVLPQLKKHDYDLIYVDAGHSYLDVWNDIVRSWPLLKCGG